MTNELNCDSIKWLIDLFGTIEILELLINENKSKKNVVINLDDKDGEIVGNGLYFTDGHWYIYKNGIRSDSYLNGYQIYKTAHFCQTFAVLMFLGKEELLKFGEYSYNIKVAMKYWINLLNNDEYVSNIIIKEAQVMGEHDYPNLFIDKVNVRLQNINKQQMISFLQYIHDHSDLFINC
tara:strand:- start:251 stop:787 length:537 start_codon:yes stop_codon:yes gene_type:complete